MGIHTRIYRVYTIICIWWHAYPCNVYVSSKPYHIIEKTLICRIPEVITITGDRSLWAKFDAHQFLSTNGVHAPLKRSLGNVCLIGVYDMSIVVEEEILIIWCSNSRILNYKYHQQKWDSPHFFLTPPNHPKYNLKWETAIWSFSSKGTPPHFPQEIRPYSGNVNHPTIFVNNPPTRPHFLG